MRNHSARQVLEPPSRPAYDDRMAMQSTVIRTKLSPPVTRHNDITRARLLAALGSAPLPRLITVCAPAGFGKSTVLGQWHSQMQDRGLRTGWLSLDERDRDTKRFLHHLIAACRLAVANAGAGALPYLDNTVEPDVAMVLAPLVNDLAGAGAPIALFIDDYHFAAAAPVNEFMELFLNLAPPGMVFVMASRIAVPIPLAPLRLRGDILEFGAAELRFDNSESERFIHHASRGRLDSAVAVALDERAEGWPAGLQLALLSMDGAGQGDPAAHAQAGNLRDVADYLVTEVLARQPADMRQFMLRTAVLSRMNAKVCAVLTGREDAQALLARMEAQNLFLLPLDQTGTWYRYHHLFHDLLLAQLRREHPAELVSLHAAASDWFRDADLPDEAFEYGLLSGDTARIVELVTCHFRGSIGAGRAPQVLAWCERIPEAIKRAHPIVLAIEATALFHMRGHDRARALLRILEQVDPASVPSADELDYYLRCIRAGVAMSEDDVEAALPPLAEAFADVGDYAMGTINNIAGYCLAELGDLEAARARLETARDRHHRHGAPFGVAYSDCFLAIIDCETGEFHQALARVSGASGRAPEKSPSYAAPVPDAMRGIIYCEQDRLPEAMVLLRQNLPLLEKVGHINVVCRGYVALARIHAARGDTDIALQTLEHARTLLPANRRGRLRTLSLLEAAASSIAVRRQAPSVIANALARLGVNPGEEITLAEHWDRPTCTRALLQARLYLLQGEHDRALALADRLRALARAATRHAVELDYLLLGAAAAAGLQDRAGRDERLDAALAIAEAGGMIRSLAEAPPALLGVLEQRLGAAPETRHCQALRKAVAGSGAGAPGATQRFEPLSERERQILALMADGCANPLIADRLAISENTVKWHAKNIYAKLRAANRTEAVSIARQHHLIGAPA